MSFAPCHTCINAFLLSSEIHEMDPRVKTIKADRIARGMSRGAYEAFKRMYFPIRRSQMGLSARLLSSRFRCNSLEGRAYHGLTINSDLTLTCNCSDYKGEGQLGSLREHSIMELLDGEKASAFRESLRNGRLPIDRCIGCADLERIKKREMDRSIKAPLVILVENSAACNLRCTQCNRKEVHDHRKQQRMSLEDMRIVARAVKETGITRVNFYNLGEPFLSPHIHEELGILKEVNPDLELYCSTNGLLMKGDEKIEGALLFDHIFITLPGGDQASVEKYQKGQDFEQTTQNIADLIKARGRNMRPVLEWKYLLFNWNDNELNITKAMKKAEEIGVDIISFWPTIYPPWGAPYKYHLGLSTTNRLGKLTENGREIVLNKKLLQPGTFSQDYKRNGAGDSS